MIYDSRVGFLDLKALSSKDKLESEDKNKLIAYMKPPHKIQNDVLTQEMVKADGFRLASILGIIGTCFMIYNYMSPDTTVKTAGHVATSASNILNRASTLVNGTSSISETASKTFHHFGYGEEKQKNQFFEKIQEEYIDEEMRTLNRKNKII